MSWQRRLAELAAAGGLAISSAGCPAVIPGGTCNANPDPCCSQPEGTACQAQMACIAQPTVTCCQGVQTFDNTCMPATCDPLADNDFDGAGPLTKTGSTCGNSSAIGCYGPSLQGTAFGDPVVWKCDTPDAGAEDLRHGAALTSTFGCAPGYIVVNMDGLPHCAALCSPGEAYMGNPNAQQPHGLAPHACNATDAVGTFTNESCVYSWRFEVGIDGTLHRSATSDTVGICIDHSQLRYDADHDGLAESPWPECESLPLHGTNGAADAVMMGCVKSTTAGL